jgi:hypothetical protein
MDETDDRSKSGRWWPVALVAVLGAAGLGGLVLTGVRSKEDCSSIVGSIEVDDRLYRPCELVGYLQGAVGAALVTLVVATAVREARIRAAVAGVGALVTVVIGLVGLGTLSL